MWLLTKRWYDWAMRDFWFMHRLGPRPLALRYHYEKAGLQIHDEPIPWNAETVVVEAVLRLPAGAARRKTDFQACVAGQTPVTADDLVRQENDRHLISFRLPAPPRTTSVVLRWRNHRMAELTLPVLTAEKFVENLRLELPTIFVRLGEQSVACQTYIAAQCTGLMASAVIASPTSLVPLLDIGLVVEFRSERSDIVATIPLRLTSSQLGQRQALVSVAPRNFAHRLGAWTATWRAGQRVLSTRWMRAISRRHFQRSLHVCDTRFLAEAADHSVRLSRQVPPLDGSCRIGPCFFVSSKETGMAGLCSLEIRLHGAGGEALRVLAEQQVLITDGPTMVAVGTLDAGDLAQVGAFELRLRQKSLTTVSLSAIPAATFTSEGGFRPAVDFTWSGAAEEELMERLNRLLADEAGNDR